MKKIKLFVVITLLFSTLGYLLAIDKVSDFKLEDMTGKKVSLSQFQKKGLVIIDFWATWCSPCKKALPKLNEIHNKYKDVSVVTICTDKPRQKAKAKAFVKSNRYTFNVLFDFNRILQKKMSITSIPRTLIIDQEGKVLYDHTGYVKGDEKHYYEVIEKWHKSQTMKKKTKLTTEKENNSATGGIVPKTNNEKKENSSQDQ